MDHLLDLLILLGVRWWRNIDYDGPFILQESWMTGEHRTVVAANRIRHLYPGRRAKWEVQHG